MPDGVEDLLHGRSNWGRWGTDDQIGAINLITPAKRARAAALVRTGRTESLARPFPTAPGPANPTPAAHYTMTAPRGTGGIATDYYGIEYHGTASTHLDALCHAWDRRGMWQGRDPAVEITSRGSNWAGVEHWRTGVFTRGVLLDVPRYRGEPCVTRENPVRGAELARIAEAQGVTLEPGDALVVYSGRDRWDADAGHPPWGAETRADGRPHRPGLHGDCLGFLREHDCAVLAWDMLDHAPHDPVPWSVHGALFAYGVAIVDNCELAGLAAACADEGRYEFLFLLAPLVVPGGTGSPVNPLALF